VGTAVRGAFSTIAADEIYSCAFYRPVESSFDRVQATPEKFELLGIGKTSCRRDRRLPSPTQALYAPAGLRGLLDIRRPESGGNPTGALPK